MSRKYPNQIVRFFNDYPVYRTGGADEQIRQIVAKLGNRDFAFLDNVCFSFFFSYSTVLTACDFRI